MAEVRFGNGKAFVLENRGSQNSTVKALDFSLCPTDQNGNHHVLITEILLATAPRTKVNR